ncbi:MAG: hypothetical protein EON56_01815 [Alphaproteobacteria bacterium]|nr:MAG: hypothetical protein EON56_01815 [Alphaproteobacteria bacterium]
METLLVVPAWAPGSPERRRLRDTAIVIGFAMAALALLIWACLRFIVPLERLELQARSEREHAALLSAAHAILHRWPVAVIRYGSVFTHEDGTRLAVCGRVDVQQRREAYSGMERFTYLDGQLIIEEVDGAAAVTQAWSEICE